MKRDRENTRTTITNIIANDSAKSALDSISAIVDDIETIVIAYTTRNHEVGYVASTHGEAEIIGLLEVAMFSVIDRMEKL